MRKTLAIAAFAAVLALLSAIVLEKHSSNKFTVTVESFMENVRVVNKKHGEHQWSLNTAKATFAENGDTARMQTVTLFIPKEGMTVEADSGLYDFNSGDLRLTGNVKAKTGDYLIRTGSINIRPDKEEISTDGRVFLEGRGLRIEGQGLRTKPQHKIRLLGNVKALFL